ncbi:MAG: right-handed parallel beta-helix repeat-containing protein [candidate division Zixibacteria bacterium]|nr:right-handed parallel beta-helix repeat-containing protein [candidate division Zixibacteria bacterium]
MRPLRLQVVFALLMSATTVQAGVLNVPSDYVDLKTALAAAGKCDTILLDSGTYSGTGFRELPINDSICVTVTSRYGASFTTIDLQNGVFLSRSFQGPHNQISAVGLTLANGWPAIRYRRGDQYDVRECIFLQCQVGVEAGDYAGDYRGVTACQFRNCAFGIIGLTNASMKVSFCQFYNCDAGIATGNFPYMEVTNCTFINNHEGVWLHSACCIRMSANAFHGNWYGLFTDGQSGDLFGIFSCNNVFGNTWNYWGPPDQTGSNGNFSADPLYCDTANGRLTLTLRSPLLSANNSCHQLIGQTATIACDCGDVDVSGNVDISDVTALISYLFLGGPPPVPLEAAEVDPSPGIDISDLTYLIDHLFIRVLPVPCGG